MSRDFTIEIIDTWKRSEGGEELHEARPHIIPLTDEAECFIAAEYAFHPSDAVFGTLATNNGWAFRGNRWVRAFRFKPDCDIRLAVNIVEGAFRRWSQ